MKRAVVIELRRAQSIAPWFIMLCVTSSTISPSWEPCFWPRPRDKSRTLFRHAQIAGIDELDELRRFMIEDDRRVGGVRRCRPELLVEGLDVGGSLEGGVLDLVFIKTGKFLFQRSGGVAAVTIRAAQDDVRRAVHILDAMMAGETRHAFGVGFGAGLVNPIARRKRSGICPGARSRRRRKGPFHGDRDGNVQGQQGPGHDDEGKK